MATPSTPRAVWALARKDLRLLSRNRGALFFALGWPVLVALFFGMLFGGPGEKGHIPVVVVDEDGSPGAARLVERLRASADLELSAAPRAEAEALVRAGKRTAAVIIPAGYGAADARLFYGAPRQLELAVDPSRTAEAAMLEGILTGAAMQGMQDALGDRDQSRKLVDQALSDLDQAPPGEERDANRAFLEDVKTYLERPSAKPQGKGGGWKPVSITRRAVQAQGEAPRSAFDLTFPQGVIWGVIGSALTFALSLVTERTRGTLLRLQTAPIGRVHVLLGKALACFLTIAGVEALLFAVGRLFFGVVPSSWTLLALSALCLAACFVGIMILVATLGRTEQSAGGLGWAVMLPLSMIGGGMMPLFAMPAWMQTVAVVSPVRWGILALEGALWRGFTPAQLLAPCAVLLAVGAAGFAAGVRAYGRDP
ncbi:MAG: ABC transporter permease [Anaeromyxobacter sp.]